MKLSECTEPHLYRGTVLRYKGAYPYDKEYVEFMICEYHIMMTRSHRLKIMLTL